MFKDLSTRCKIFKDEKITIFYEEKNKLNKKIVMNTFKIVKGSNLERW